MKTLLSLWKRFWSLHPRHRIELTLFAMVAVFVFRWSILPGLHLGINNLMWTGKVFAAESELQFGGKLPEYDIDLPFGDTDRTKYDLDLLSKAVAFAETSSCTDGTAVKRLNCHGIMAWKYVARPCGAHEKADAAGNCYTKVRYPRYFKSHAQSHEEFKRIWLKYYKAFPDRDLADKWTGKDRTPTWLTNVCTKYPHPSCADTLKAL